MRPVPTMSWQVDMMTDSWQIQMWQVTLANFLVPCLELCMLSLRFQSPNGWLETEAIFEHIAKKAILPKLQQLSLSMMRCSGQDLRAFLGNHRGLESLKLHRMDITGDIAVADMLSSLQLENCALASFRLVSLLKTRSRFTPRRLAILKRKRISTRTLWLWRAFSTIETLRKHGWVSIVKLDWWWRVSVCPIFHINWAHRSGNTHGTTFSKLTCQVITQ